MRRIGIGLLVLIAIVLVMALCFDAFEGDEAEIEVEESRAPAVETLAQRPASGRHSPGAVRPDGRGAARRQSRPPPSKEGPLPF